VQRLNDGNLSFPPSWKLPPKVLIFLLVVTLPLLNPWVRGDGVGYYAFARALLIQHNLDFAADYQHANEGFREARLDESGQPKDIFRTSTGHLDNHFTVGPAMLWAPFLVAAHGAVLLARAAGAQVAANGFSFPYVLAMAVGTLLYGFLALVISYRVACRFVPDRWALFATIAIWWASSLPVYMYFNPSWSHAHSAFAVALFFWFWLKTRDHRTTVQWALLGLIAGLMLNIYYPNALVVLLLLPEVISAYREALRTHSPAAEAPKSRQSTNVAQLLLRHTLFGAAVVVALLPILLTKYRIYGSFFETGYIPISRWNWLSPWFLSVLFSSNHGLFSWTPLLLFAVVGLFFFCWRFPDVGVSVACVFLAFFYFMAAYPDWAGISSYGNRFFVSLTVFFVLGLATFLQAAAERFHSIRGASLCFATLLSVFALWNLGLIFQWGAHLIPARGPVSWRQVADNQFRAVPRQLASMLRSYLLQRGQTLHQIEERDIDQLKHRPQP
jgi:hypothetical protein